MNEKGKKTKKNEQKIFFSFAGFIVVENLFNNQGKDEEWWNVREWEREREKKSIFGDR